MKKKIKFKNYILNKNELKNIISEAFTNYGIRCTSSLADEMKELGFVDEGNKIGNSEGNQIIIAGTASYQFNHFYKYYQDYNKYCDKYIFIVRIVLLYFKKSYTSCVKSNGRLSKAIFSCCFSSLLHSADTLLNLSLFILSLV